VLAFSGGIGEHSSRVRDAVACRLGFLGSFGVQVVVAREELVAARETRRLLRR
jgi:hypothetical protein